MEPLSPNTMLTPYISWARFSRVGVYLSQLRTKARKDTFQHCIGGRGEGVCDYFKMSVYLSNTGLRGESKDNTWKPTVPPSRQWHKHVHTDASSVPLNDKCVFRRALCMPWNVWNHRFRWKMLEDVVEDVYPSHAFPWKTLMRFKNWLNLIILNKGSTSSKEMRARGARLPQRLPTSSK